MRAAHLSALVVRDTTRRLGGRRQSLRMRSAHGVAQNSDRRRLWPPRVTTVGRRRGWRTDWKVESADGRSLSVYLAAAVKFHDGTPADADDRRECAAGRCRLPSGTGLQRRRGHRRDHATIEIEIRLRRRSPFVLGSADVADRKPGHALSGTGPFSRWKPGADRDARQRDYYLGTVRDRPDRVQTYPTVRAAWADMLRGRIDMLYEVGTRRAGLPRSRRTRSPVHLRATL